MTSIARVEPFIPVSDRELAMRNLTAMGSYLGIFMATSAAAPFLEGEVSQMLLSLAATGALCFLNLPEVTKRQKAIQQIAREEHPSFEEHTGIQWDASRFTVGLIKDCFFRVVYYLNEGVLTPERNPFAWNMRKYDRQVEKIATVLDPLVEAPNVYIVAKRCFTRCQEAYRTLRTSPGKALARTAVSLFNLGAESLFMFAKVEKAYRQLFPRVVVSAPSFYTQTVITETESGPTIVTETTREFNPAEAMDPEQLLEATRRRFTELYVEENARPVPAGIDWEAIENNRTGLSLSLSLGGVRPEIHEPQPLNRLRMQ